MRFTFIRPPQVVGKANYQATTGTAPIGMAYLAAQAKKAGYRVKVIDALEAGYGRSLPIDDTEFMIHGLTADEIVERIPEDSHCVGLSCLFSNEWIYIRKVIGKIRSQFPQMLIVAGGEHISALPEYSLKDCPELDICCVGEGEQTLYDLLKGVREGQDLNSIPGLVMRDSEGVPYRTDGRRRYANVNDIDRPDWSVFPVESYLEKGMGMGNGKQRSLPMLASRGCPYRCTFCSSPQMWTTKWQARNVDDVIDEIKYYHRRYKVNNIELFDLTTVIKKSWIIDFCQKLIEADLNITWCSPAGTRSEALTKEVIELMVASGCCKIHYAPESGAKDTIKRIKKKVNLDNMVTSIQNAVDAGASTRINLIFGLPGQTMSECWASVFYALKLCWVGLHDLNALAFAPYPGSELFNDIVADGEIRLDKSFNGFLAGNVHNNIFTMRSWSEHIPSWMIPVFTLGLMGLFYSLQFLFRPQRLFRAIYRLAKGSPFTTFENALATTFKQWLMHFRSEKVN